MTERAGVSPRYIGWIVMILALLSVFQLAYFSWDNRSRTQCQTRYNVALADALRIRAQYAEQDRRNNVEFVRARGEAKTPEAARKALSEYLATQESIERARQENPIPELPPGRCS